MGVLASPQGMCIFLPLFGGIGLPRRVKQNSGLLIVGQRLYDAASTFEGANVSHRDPNRYLA